MGRTEKSIKNISFGIISQVILFILNFITRSVVARVLGNQIVSMNGLFQEIITCLSMAELGIGSAIVYNLYKPLAENDQEKVSQLMTFFKSAYRVISVIVVCAGLILSCFIQYIVKDITYPLWYVRIIFLLFVVNSASSYLFSYKISLLNADQNLYIYTFFSTIFTVVASVINILILYLFIGIGREYCFIVYLVASTILSVLSNFLISRKVDKLYPYLSKKQLDKESKTKVFDNVKNIFVKELSGKITGSTDNILISVMVSTIMVAPNQFYTMLTAVFIKTINQIEAGIKASLGNLFAVGSSDDCSRVVTRLTWGYAVFAIWGCTGLFVCAGPFIVIWVGAEYLYEDYILFIIAINMFAYIVSRPIYDAMHVAGLFKEGRNISIIGSVANLVVSIALGKPFGIFGIFLGTFCTYVIQTILKTYYVYKRFFKTTAIKYVCLLICFTMLLLTSMLGCRFLCSLFSIDNKLLEFLVNGIISSVVYWLFVIIAFRKNQNYVYYKELLLSKLHNFAIKRQ